MQEVKKRGRPKVKSESQQELDRAEKQFDAFKENVDSLTLDRMNKAPVEEVEPQTQISQREIARATDVYLKPIRYIASKEKFNEAYRDKYNFAKEYVYFIAENKEIVGDNIELWTKHFPGVPAEFWNVPVNKPVWGPRYLAEQIKGCKYHRLRTEDKITRDEGDTKYYGHMVVDTTIQRLDAVPASKQRSIFTGANSF
jgi:hypothetical protein